MLFPFFSNARKGNSEELNINLLHTNLDHITGHENEGVYEIPIILENYSSYENKISRMLERT